MISYAAQPLSIEMLNLNNESYNVFVNEHQSIAEKFSKFNYWNTFFSNNSLEINTKI